MRNTLFFLTTLAAVAGSAQNFSKGYVVTDKGDSIPGEIKINPKKEFDIFNKLTFRDVNGAQKNYKPEKVKRYGFENRKFCSLDSDGERKFFESLACGKICLYKSVTETTRMNESSFEPEYYLSKQDQKLVSVKESKFKKQIGEWMKDQPDVAAEYPDEKKFNPEKAAEVIKHYNSLP